MIQVCSNCGTRWNVRERQRQWCPRCRGALMAPLAGMPAADPRWGTHGRPPTQNAPVSRRASPRLPAGFRWIAVRPGAAPPAPRGRHFRGPTPRYAVIPRWGLAARVEQDSTQPKAPAKIGPSAVTVRATLFATLLVLCIATLVFAGRYVLLVINRTTLLNSVVAAVADWLGDLASIASLVAVVATLVVLTRWLIARRAAAFKHYALPEKRSFRGLVAGCVLPFVNLLWAPVFVIELARIEDHIARLRRPIALWWLAWTISYGASIYAIVTSFATDAQGIATNTTWMAIAYLFAAAVIASVARVFEGFELKPVERPAHRWLMVDPERQDPPAEPASASAVEMQGQEPAA